MPLLFMACDLGPEINKQLNKQTNKHNKQSQMIKEPATTHIDQDLSDKDKLKEFFHERQDFNFNVHLC